MVASEASTSKTPVLGLLRTCLRRLETSMCLYDALHKKSLVVQAIVQETQEGFGSPLKRATPQFLRLYAPRLSQGYLSAD